MNETRTPAAYQASKIEDEPILGPVLFLPDGSIRRLSWLDRLLVALRLSDAKSLEARYFVRPLAG